MLLLMQRSLLFCYFGPFFRNFTRQCLAETNGFQKSHELRRSQLWQQQHLVDGLLSGIWFSTNLATAKTSSMSCCFTCWMKSAVLIFSCIQSFSVVGNSTHGYMHYLEWPWFSLFSIVEITTRQPCVNYVISSSTSLIIQTWQIIFRITMKCSQRRRLKSYILFSEGR